MLPCHQPIPPTPLPLLPHQNQPQSLHRLHPIRDSLSRRNRFPQIPRPPPPAPVERFRQRNPARRLQHPQRFHAACLLQPTPRIPKAERLAHPAARRRAAGKTLRRHQGRHPRRSRLRGQGLALQFAMHCLCHALESVSRKKLCAQGSPGGRHLTTSLFPSRGSDSGEAASEPIVALPGYPFSLRVSLRGPSRNPFESRPTPWCPSEDNSIFLPALCRPLADPYRSPSNPFVALRRSSWPFVEMFLPFALRGHLLPPSQPLADPSQASSNPLVALRRSSWPFVDIFLPFLPSWTSSSPFPADPSQASSNPLVALRRSSWPFGISFYLFSLRGHLLPPSRPSMLGNPGRMRGIIGPTFVVSPNRRR